MLAQGILLSMRPVYAERIFDGTKTVELRRVRPKISVGDTVLVYVSSPVKAIIGCFLVDGLVCLPPEQLWRRVRHCAGVTRSEFDDYYRSASSSTAIFIRDAKRFDHRIELNALRARSAGFRPPRSYRYVHTMRSEMRNFLGSLNALD